MEFAMVGEKLRELAEDATEAKMTDAFGRSAINRFYYAAFLSGRHALSVMNPKWRSVRHSNLPDHFKGVVLKRIKKTARTQEKSGLLNPSKSSDIQTKANTAASQLSNLMTRAYAARCDADYEPEKPVNREEGVLSLAGVRVSDAQNWPRKAEQYSKVLLRLWNELGL